LFFLSFVVVAVVAVVAAAFAIATVDVLIESTRQGSVSKNTKNKSKQAKKL